MRRYLDRLLRMEHKNIEVRGARVHNLKNINIYVDIPLGEIVEIEHELDVIRNADYIVDMGPGGGSDGGRIIATGTPDDIRKSAESVTAKYI